MFLTEYFASVRVPDSATCHVRTPPPPHSRCICLLTGLLRKLPEGYRACIPSWGPFLTECPESGCCLCGQMHAELLGHMR